MKFKQDEYISWIKNRTIYVKEIKKLKVLEFFNIITLYEHKYGNTVNECIQKLEDETKC